MAEQPDVRSASQSHVQLFAEDESAPVRWRLLSGNNRELGRGAGSYDGRESARLAIKHLQARAEDLERAVLRGASCTWTWQLSLDGSPVATSGHRYDRLIRCRQGVEHFVRQLSTCEIGPGLMFTQSRRWAGSSARRMPDRRDLS